MGAQCSCSDAADVVYYDEVADLCGASVHTSEQIQQDPSAIRAFSALNAASPTLVDDLESRLSERWQQHDSAAKEPASEMAAVVPKWGGEVVRSYSRQDSVKFEEKSSSRGSGSDGDRELPMMGRLHSRSRSTLQPEEEKNPTHTPAEAEAEAEAIMAQETAPLPALAPLPEPPAEPPTEQAELNMTGQAAVPFAGQYESEEQPVVLPMLLKARQSNGQPYTGWDSASAGMKWEGSDPERFQVLVERESPDDYLGLDVKQVQGDCLQVVHVSPDGAAAAGGALKQGDIIKRVNGIGGSCHRMIAECDIRADLTFDVFRPHQELSDCGCSSAASVARSHGGNKGRRPTVPPLKLPPNPGSPHRPRRQSAPAAGFRASIKGALGRGGRI